MLKADVPTIQRVATEPAMTGKERFEHADRQRRLGADIFSYGSILLLRNSVSLITLPLYVNWLSQEEFAVLDIINAGIAFFTLIVFQLNIGYARYYYETRTAEQQQCYMSTLFWCYLGISLLVLMIGMPIAYNVAADTFPQIEGAAIAALFAIAAFLPMALFEFALINARLSRNTKRYAVYSLSETLLRAALTITFIVMGAGIAGYFFAVFTASLFMMSIAIWQDRGVIMRGSIEGLLKTLRFTAPIIPGAVAGYINIYATRFIAVAMLPLKQVALYAFAMKIAIVAKFMIQSFRMGWLPFAMEQIQQEEKGEGVFIDTLSKYVAFSALFVVMLGLLAPYIVGLIAPAGYSEAARLVPIVVAAFLVSGSISIIEVGSQIAEKTLWSSIAAISGGAVGMALLLLSINRLGISAMAYSLLLSAVIMISVMLYGSHRCHPIGYSRLSLLGLLVGLPVTGLAVASISGPSV